jgi:hypothetical protein
MFSITVYWRKITVFQRMPHTFPHLYFSHEKVSPGLARLGDENSDDQYFKMEIEKFHISLHPSQHLVILCIKFSFHIIMNMMKVRFTTAGATD